MNCVLPTQPGQVLHLVSSLKFDGECIAIRDAHGLHHVRYRPCAFLTDEAWRGSGHLQDLADAHRLRGPDELCWIIRRRDGADQAEYTSALELVTSRFAAGTRVPTPVSAFLLEHPEHRDLQGNVNVLVLVHDDDEVFAIDFNDNVHAWHTRSSGVPLEEWIAALRADVIFMPSIAAGDAEHLVRFDRLDPVYGYPVSTDAPVEVRAKRLISIARDALANAVAHCATHPSAPLDALYVERRVHPIAGAVRLLEAASLAANRALPRFARETERDGCARVGGYVKGVAVIRLATPDIGAVVAGSASWPEDCVRTFGDVARAAPHLASVPMLFRHAAFHRIDPDMILTLMRRLGGGIHVLHVTRDAIVVQDDGVTDFATIASGVQAAMHDRYAVTVHADRFDILSVADGSFALRNRKSGRVELHGDAFGTGRTRKLFKSVAMALMDHDGARLGRVIGSLAATKPSMTPSIRGLLEGLMTPATAALVMRAPGNRLPVLATRESSLAPETIYVDAPNGVDAVLAELTRHGAELQRDVQVLGGTLIAIRASAVALPLLVNEHELVDAVAAELTRTSSVPVSRSSGSAVAWDTSARNAPLRAWFEHMTAHVRRSSTDKRTYTESADAKRKRVAYEKTNGKTQLTVLPQGARGVPCRDSVLLELVRGERVDDVAFTKYVAESRAALDMSEAQIVAECRNHGVDLARYPERFEVTRLGGFRLRSLRVEDGCNGLRAYHASLCVPHACYREAPVGGAPKAFVWSAAGPNPKAYRAQAQGAVAAALKASRLSRKVRFVSAPMRAGKTYTEMERAVQAARAGLVTHYYVGAHDQLDVAAEYVRKHLAAQVDALAVHVYGQERACKFPVGNQPNCRDCPHGLDADYARGSGTSRTNRDAIAELEAKRFGVLELAELAELAETHGVCARTVAFAMLPLARIALMPWAYLLDARVRRLIPQNEDFLVVDEADAMVEELPGLATERYVLATTRTHTSFSHESGDCNDQCKGCHYQFAHVAEETPRRGAEKTKMLSAPTRLARVAEFEEPHHAVNVLRRGLSLLQGLTLRPGVLGLKSVAENISRLEAALPDTSKMTVRETDPKTGTPMERNARPLDVWGKLLDRHVEQVNEPWLERLGSTVLRVVFETCLVRTTSITKKSVPGMEADPRGELPSRWEEVVVGLPSGARRSDVQKQLGITAQDCDVLDSVWKFIALSNGTSAMQADIATVVFRRRPWKKAFFVPGCGIELVRIRNHDIEEVRTRLLSPTHDTVLVSGTIIDPPLMARMLGLREDQYEHVPVAVPMHSNLAIFVEGPAALDENRVPRYRTLDEDDVAAVVSSFVVELQRAWDADARVPKRRRPNVLVFAKSKAAQRKLVDALETAAPDLRVEFRFEKGRRADHNKWHDAKTARGAIGSVFVDYVRSVGSRGVDSPEYDLVVVAGNGYPAFTDYPGFAAALSAQEQHVPSVFIEDAAAIDPVFRTAGVSDVAVTRGDVTPMNLANASRLGATLQAMMRSSGEKKERRAVIVLNTMLRSEMPEDYAHRTLYGTDVNSEGTNEQRIAKLVEATVAFLVDRQVEVTVPVAPVPQPPSFMERAVTQADALRAAIVAECGVPKAEPMLERIAHLLRTTGAVDMPAAVGRKANVMRLIAYLVEAGMLVHHHDGRRQYWSATDAFQPLVAVRACAVSPSAADAPLPEPPSERDAERERLFARTLRLHSVVQDYVTDGRTSLTRTELR